jgi:hypothetical protein
MLTDPGNLPRGIFTAAIFFHRRNMFSPPQYVYGGNVGANLQESNFVARINDPELEPRQRLAAVCWIAFIQLANA